MRASRFALLLAVLYAPPAPTMAADSPEAIASNPRIRSGELGFTRLVVSQRMQLSPSHVYTYHQEGLRPGGGLWVMDFSAEEISRTMILGSPDGVMLESKPRMDMRALGEIAH